MPCLKKDWEYQTASGQSKCKTCECPESEYIPTNVDNTCGFDKNMSSLCQKCDVCTPHTFIGDRSSIQRCSDRNWAYGRNAIGECKPCAPCASRNLYSLVNSTRDFCNMDASTCRQLFYKPQNSEPPAAQIFLPANIGEGLMPFVSGWQRQVGTQHKAGNPVALPGATTLQGHKAVLPYYSLCVNTMPNAEYTNFQNETLQAIMNAESNWAYDCNPHVTAHCKDNFFAKFEQWSDVYGIPYMSACLPCPPNSNTNCSCDTGYASPSDLDRMLLSSPRHMYEPGMACVNCATQVYILARGNSMQAEAMLCTGRCKGRQILQTVNGEKVCVNCPGTQIPLPTRDECQTCNPGQYAVSVSQMGVEGQFWDCKACDTATFSELPGQTECTPKHTSCTEGHKLLMNSDITRDNDCVPCGDDCMPGEMKIMFANATGSCNSQGQPYFGCLSMSSGVKAGFPPNTRFGYGAGDGLAKAHLEVDECRGKPLHSSWVTYNDNMAGMQCYFACDYGVFSDAYHQTVSDFVLHERVDLRSFLPTDSFYPAERPNSIRYEGTFGYLADAEPLTDWLVYVDLALETTCPECLTTMATNTFLMLAEKMPPLDMCMSPEQANQLSHRCERGYVYENGTVIPKCALLARQGMYKTRPRINGDTTLVPSAYYVNPSCRSEDTRLQSFQVPCSRHCLTERHAKATAAAEFLFPGSLAATRMSYITYFLSGTYWKNNGNTNPYEHPDDNQCDPTTCAANTFRYMYGEHYACIPCEYGDAVCKSVYSPEPRFFNINSCADSTREATSDNVCDPCQQTMAHAVLITHTEGTPRAPVSMFNDWWDVRSIQLAYSTHFSMDTSQTGWEAINCRYKCDEVCFHLFLI